MWSDKSMQGEAEGGGFLDQTYNGNVTQTNKTESVRGNSIVPLMIGHLMDENPDTLNLWGSPIKLVQIVAYVNKFERLTTKISYELVDETGTMMAFQWIDDSFTDLVIVPEGSYCRVIGSLREQGDSRHLFVLNIKQINSLTEVFEHILEVTYACMRGENLITETTFEPTVELQPSKAVESMAEVETSHGMNREQALVFKVIQSANMDDTGIERSQLRKKLPIEIHSKVDGILDFLVCEGHIYTTSTDDHFKTT